MATDSDIKAAQDGDETLVLGFLIEYGWREKGKWRGYLGKYEQMLWHGKIDLKNKDTRRFLQLYTKDGEIRRLLTWQRLSYRVQYQTQSLANYLQDSVRQYWDRQELRQELTVLFLDCLKRYKPKEGVSFSGYISNYYRYRVYDLLKKTVFKLEVGEAEYFQILKEEPSVSDLVLNAPVNLLHAREREREELGLFWTNGLCGPLFEDLTVFERVILRDRYYLKKTDLEIASQYGYHRNSIYNKRHKAIKKIEEKKERL